MKEFMTKGVRECIRDGKNNGVDGRTPKKDIGITYVDEGGMGP